MNHIDAFWEVPGFWLMALVLLAVAALMAFVISAGPAETPFDGSHEHSLSQPDADTKHAWEMTVAEWDALTPEGRAWYRDNITKGPRFHELHR